MAEAATFTGPGELVTAMRLARDKNEHPIMAEKDREEINRGVGSWILDFGGTVRMANREYLIVRTLGGEMTASPGNWVVKHEDNSFSVWSHLDFFSRYKTLKGS